MRPTDENIKNQIKQLDDRTNSEFDQKTLNDMFAAMGASGKASNKPNMWSLIMNSKITKLSIAAVIVIVVLISFSQISNDIDVATPSYANILEEISKTKDVTFNQIINDNTPSKHLASRHGLLRYEFEEGGGYWIMDFVNCRNMQVNPQQKKVLLTQRVGRYASNGYYNYLGWIRDLHEKQGQYVGQEEFEGKIANIFVVQSDPYEKYTLWVDPSTNLPLRVKQECFPNIVKDIVFPIMSLSPADFADESEVDKFRNQSSSICISSSRGSGLGINEGMTVLMKDFQWNAELDMSLFSFDVPDGYTVEESEFDVSESDEKVLVEALAFWVETNDGQFPADIDDLGDPNLVKPLLKKAYDKDGDVKAEFDIAYKQMNKILSALYFVQENKVIGSWEYTGADVQYGDAESIVYWFKHDDSEEYTIIYGDLTIEKTTQPPF